MKVNLANAPWHECECGGQHFEPGLMFKRLSALVSPTQKEEVIPVEIFTCKSCGKIRNF